MTIDSASQARFLVRIVDDDEGVLTGLSFLLTCLGWKSLSYPSAVDFLERDNHQIPGCILLDVRMPQMSGLELQQKLFEENCSLPIVIITGHADVETAVRTLRKGAFDFLTKPVSSEKLQAVLEDCCSRWLVKNNGLDDRRILAVYKSLTDRERDILKLVTQDLTSKQIGERLGLSERTVQGHRLNLSKKFNVHGKTELVSCLRVAESLTVSNGY